MPIAFFLGSAKKNNSLDGTGEKKDKMVAGDQL